MTSSRFDGRTYNGCTYEATYDETTIEPIEPMPDWTVAKETWKWSWPLHVYGVTCLSLLLAVYSSCSLVHHCYQNIRLASASYNLSPSFSTPPPTLGLASNSELTMAQSLVVLSCIFSAVHLVADPYESNCFEAGTTNPLVRKFTRVLRFTSFPALIGSTVCLQLVILRMSKVTLYPRCLQRSRRILSIFLLNLCILAATDCVAMHVPSIRMLLLLSRGSAIWWALVVCFVFVYKGVQIANFADVARHTLHEICARNKNRRHQWTRDGAAMTSSVDGCPPEQQTMNGDFVGGDRYKAERTKDKGRRVLSGLGFLRRSPTLGDDDSLQSEITSIELSPTPPRVIVKDSAYIEAQQSIPISESKRKRRSRRNHRFSNHRHHHCSHRSSSTSRRRCSCDSSDDQVSMNDYATDTTSTFIHYRSDEAATVSVHDKLSATTDAAPNSPPSASSSYALASLASPVSTTTTLPWTPSVIATDDLLNPNPGSYIGSGILRGRTTQNDAEGSAHGEQRSHSKAVENGTLSDTSLVGILGSSWDNNGYMGDTETPTLSHRSKMSRRRMILMSLFRRHPRSTEQLPTNNGSITSTDCVERSSCDREDAIHNGISFINMQYATSDQCVVDDDKRTAIDEELGADDGEGGGDSNCRRFPIEQIESVSSCAAGEASLTLKALREGRSVEKSLKAICSMALLLFICCILHMYAMFGVYGVLSKRKTLEPWPWYIYQTIVR